MGGHARARGLLPRPRPSLSLLLPIHDRLHVAVDRPGRGAVGLGEEGAPGGDGKGCGSEAASGRGTSRATGRRTTRGIARAPGGLSHGRHARGRGRAESAGARARMARTGRRRPVRTPGRRPRNDRVRRPQGRHPPRAAPAAPRSPLYHRPSHVAVGVAHERGGGTSLQQVPGERGKGVRRPARAAHGSHPPSRPLSHHALYAAPAPAAAAAPAAIRVVRWRRTGGIAPEAEWQLRTFRAAVARGRPTKAATSPEPLERRLTT